MATKKNVSTSPDGSVLLDQISEYRDKAKNYNSMRDFSVGEDPLVALDLENRFRSEFQRYYTFFRQTYHKVRDKRIGAYCMVDLERETFLKCIEDKGSTNQYYPVVRSRVDFAMQTLFRGKISNIVKSGVKGNAKKRIASMQGFLDHAMGSGGGLGVIKEAAFDGALLGIGFFVNDYVIDNNNYGKGYFEWIDPYNLYFDPSMHFYNTPVYHRKIDNIKNIIKFDELYFNKYEQEGYKLTEEQLNYIVSNPNPISTENPGIIRNIKFTKGMLLNDTLTSRDYYKVDISGNTVEYIRREDEWTLSIMINGYLIYSGNNPRGNHPYKVIKKSMMPGTTIQDGIAGELESFQETYNSIQNLLLDTQKMNVGPMFFVKPGTKIPKKYLNPEGKLLREKYKMIEVESIADGVGNPIEPWYLPNASAELFKLSSDILQTSNVLGGQFNYAQFNTQARVQSDADQRRQTLSDSIITLSESISSALTRSNDEIVLIAKEKGVEKLNYFTTTKDNKQMRAEINKEELQSNYIFETEFESIRDVNVTIERQQMIEFMGYLNLIGRDPVTGRFLFNMEKLVPSLLTMFPSLDEDIILSEADFYSKQLAAQEKEMNLKAEIQTIKQKLFPEMNQGQQNATITNHPEATNSPPVGKSFEELYGAG